MNDRNLDVLTLLLLDPCLTADEAAREARARAHTATAVAAARTRPAATGRCTRHPPRRATDESTAVGF